MSVARDRLSRQEDVITTYRRRISAAGDRSIGRGRPIIFVLEDDEGPAAGTPFRWRRTAMVGTPGPVGMGVGRGTIGTPSVGRTTPAIGRENLTPLMGGGRGRGRGNVRRSALPVWYPRRPLNDITDLTRAIQRRRELQRGGEGLQTESPIRQDRLLNGPASTSGAHLEHGISMITPLPTTLKSCCPPTIGKVSKILLNVTNQNEGDSAFLTPQKKLLNNIDTVEKVVMEELRKLKRTPSAKKAEREKRVRTLLSMR